MQRFTDEEELENDDIEQLIELLSPEAFSDAGVMLKELTELSKQRDMAESPKAKALKVMFFDKLDGMHMTYSYKPLFIKAMLEYANYESGECSLRHVVSYFRDFYTKRYLKGVFVEQEKSIFSKIDFSDDEAKRVILKYPYQRFAAFKLVDYRKEEEMIAFEPHLWRGLSKQEKEEIGIICDKALERYYMRFTNEK